MCIKTLRSKNRVVGLCVNGKNFMLDKQVCHALSIEEQKVQGQISRAKDDISRIKSALDSKQYVGESDLLNLAVKFKDNGQVDVSSAQVEFKADLPEKQSQEFIILLESFLHALNGSIKKQKADLEASLANISANAS